MPHLNHVHMLTKWVETVKQVTRPTKCLNISKKMTYIAVFVTVYLFCPKICVSVK